MGRPKSIYIEVFSYPTEDESKVLKALRTLTTAKPKKTTAKLALGGKMTIFRVYVDNPKQVAETIRKIEDAGIDMEGKEDLRISKQDAFKGEIKPGKGIKIVFGASKENILI